MNNLNDLFSKLKDFAQTEQAQRIIDEASKSPGDAVRQETQRLMLDAAARDHIPRESLHRLTDIAESTKSTKEGLESLREDLEDFRRSQPPVFLQWAAIVIAALGAIVTIYELFKK
jgi:hypothetical protein